MYRRPYRLLSITAAIAACVWMIGGTGWAQEKGLLLPEWMLAPREVTGTVSVTRFRCITAPCPPPVVLVDDQVISGSLAADLMAFEGEPVSVRGVDTNDSASPDLSVFRAESFTPDPNTKWDYVTGTIEVQGGVVSIHTATGKVYKIVGAASSDALLRADSASVTLYGTISKVGARARVQDFEIHSPTFMARGELHSLMHIMGGDNDAASSSIAIPPAYPATRWPDYVLRIPSGKSFPLYGEIRLLNAGQGEIRWITIDARDMSNLRATGVSKPYHPIGIDPIWPLNVPVVPVPESFAMGVNSPRNANTVAASDTTHAANPSFVEPRGMERN